MDFYRIGDKLISYVKIQKSAKEILELRSQGLSQQDVADKLGIARTFISRLESLGELRKGERIAVIGFPIKNTDEIKKVLRDEGVDFSIIMTEKERWDFVEEKSGIDLFNTIMELAAKIRSYDTVVIIGSDYRIKIFEALLDKEVFPLVIGESPITEDVYVEPDKVRNLIKNLKTGGKN
ncbi:MAG: hypothetical protein PWQ82_728 [Thermosediminibacterales bacterium]|nr:hypothetical protein [Thermosediminibacterales bacterium]